MVMWRGGLRNNLVQCTESLDDVDIDAFYFWDHHDLLSLP